MDKFVSLVAEVALRGEVGGCLPLPGSSDVWGFVGGCLPLPGSSDVWRFVGGRGRRRGPWGTGSGGEFFSILESVVVHGPVLFLGGGWWA